MKNFQFRFLSILNLRRRERDEAGGMVGEANAAIAKVQSQIETIEEERRMLSVEEQTTRVGDISVDRLLAKGRYDLQLQADIQGLRETLGKLADELDRRQVRLRQAETEVKKFERMMEIDSDRYRNEMDRQEQMELDEMSNRRGAISRRTHAKNRD
ncbi:flagellar biosynthesis chaperone [Novipirellula aureliae]|uniref:Flagellar FliJ protein n=1 Tax=Novipirellula aureliae TaxID=2527966 RepID=A0A5C6EBY9_9BACT|nr:flagellar export protein FliJ [Novipirellula aureliae]TWU45944.1 flagellar biosynthesis chaperone [Novipirellula aureliae]